MVDMIAGGAVVEQWVAVVVVATEASTKPWGRRKRGRCSPSSWQVSLKKGRATATPASIQTFISCDDSETRLALLQAGIFVHRSAAGDNVWTRAEKILEHI
jgi:hypothetical protein